MPSALSAVARQLRWQAVRIEDADLAVDEGLQHLVIAAVDEEALRQAAQQARENSRLMQTVGAGALSLAAMTLNDMIDSTTGELKRPLEPRDMPALMRVGAELVQLSIGAPTHILSGGDSTQLEHVLRRADDQTRSAIVNGLKAALRWQQEHGG